MAFYVSVSVRDFYTSCPRVARLNGRNIAMSQGNVEKAVVQTVIY